MLVQGWPTAGPAGAVTAGSAWAALWRCPVRHKLLVVLFWSLLLTFFFFFPLQLGAA